MARGIEAGIRGLAAKVRRRLSEWKTRIPSRRLILYAGEGQARAILAEASKGRKWKIVRMEAVLMEPGAAQLPPDWVASLKEAAGEADTWLILPRQSLSVQIVELPSTQHSEIEEMLRLQISSLTPYAAAEVMSSHVLLQTPREGYSRVLLLVAKRDAIAQAVNLALTGGMDLSRVVVSTEGISRWLNSQPPFAEAPAAEGGVAVLDMDHALSDFIIVLRGRWGFTRAIPIGLSHLEKDPEKWAEKLSEEVRFSLALYQSEAGNKEKISRLVLVGPEPSTRLLVERLEGFDIPVECADPLAGLTVTEWGGAPVGRSVSWTALVGFGRTPEMPQADFRPMELLVRQMLEERGMEIAKMGLLLAAVLGMLSFIFIEKIVIGTHQLNRVGRQVAALAPEATEVEKAKMRIRFTQQRLTRDVSAMRLMDRLFRVVPEDITLTELHLEADKEMEIKGYSANMARVFEFVSSLERMSVFGTVKTRSVAKRRFGNKELSDFNLSCQIKPPKTEAEASSKQAAAAKPRGATP